VHSVSILEELNTLQRGKSPILRQQFINLQVTMVKYFSTMGVVMEDSMVSKRRLSTQSNASSTSDEGTNNIEEGEEEEEALNNILKNQKWKEFEVPSGTVKTLPVNVSKGLGVVWEFGSVSYDIEYGAMFLARSKDSKGDISLDDFLNGSKKSKEGDDLGEDVNESNESKVLEVVSSYRADSHKNYVKNYFVPPADGTLFIKFDNSYSIFRSKKIIFRKCSNKAFTANQTNVSMVKEILGEAAPNKAMTTPHSPSQNPFSPFMGNETLDIMPLPAVMVPLYHSDVQQQQQQVTDERINEMLEDYPEELRALLTKERNMEGTTPSSPFMSPR
jgi:hypothetical protein